MPEQCECKLDKTGLRLAILCPVHDSRDDDDAGGMTDAEINAKHIRLRGSTALRYAGERQKRCEDVCGFLDLPPDEEDGEWRHHRCFLLAKHKDICEFSSECALGLK